MSLLDPLLATWANQLGGTFLRPSSSFSLMALAATLTIAAFVTLLGRRRRHIRPRAIVRALFPRWLYRSRSSRVDFAWFLFSLFFSGLLFGWALLSQQHIAQVVQHALIGTLGTPAPTALPAIVSATIVAALLFLTYEFAYWLDHYLSHKIPFLWHFHLVHHSAEHLSLLTNFRIHPVDTFVFYNLVAILGGTMQGFSFFALGEPRGLAGMRGFDMLIFASSVALTHLQHSHLWIGFGPRIGRWLLSPAHHQIHHSADPAHHDRNFGSSLAIWDRLFGTLHLPARRRQRLTFGVPGLGHDPHNARAALVMPLIGAARCLKLPIGSLAPAERSPAASR